MLQWSVEFRLLLLLCSMVYSVECLLPCSPLLWPIPDESFFIEMKGSWLDLQLAKDRCGVFLQFPVHLENKLHIFCSYMGLAQLYTEPLERLALVFITK